MKPGMASNLDRAVEVQANQASPGVHLVRAMNKWSGPLQIHISLATSSINTTPSTQLPQKWTLQPGAWQSLFSMSSNDTSKEGSFGFVVKAVPGAPGARHEANYAYRWPLLNNAGRMDQGFGGTHSHSDPENYYAIDITAPVGSPVVAARPGKVMAVEDGFSRSGLDPALKTQANFVRILHEDGSMAAYVHLAHRSVRVSPGQDVKAGQQLGGLGGVGYASGPHLHFVVQINTDMKLQSVRFKMFQPQGAAQGLSRN